MSVETTGGTRWFDSTGAAEFWKNVPMRTVKKAIFNHAGTAYALSKIVRNTITYDFAKTAQGGAVIVPPEYTSIEFIAPDNRIDYATLLKGTLGDAITSIISTLKKSPIAAWDHFAAWFASKSMLDDLLSGCQLQTIDGGTTVPIDIPEFDGVTDMASFLEAVAYATEQAHGQALALYRIDTKAFGFTIVLMAQDGEEEITFPVGFIFRE